jgi:hypothetical protein
MDHPCHKCGHIVEDGKPFCSQCAAPQIRVTMPDLAPSPPRLDVSSSDLPIFPDSSGVPGALRLALTAAIDWNRALRSCAIAAVVAALVMGLGLMVPLLAAFGAGFLAVNLYHRSNAAWIVTGRSGAKLGAVCGIFFFAIAALLETIAAAFLHTGGQMREKVMDALQQAATRSNDPQVQAAFEQLKTPEGITLMLVVGVIFLFFVSIAAGSLSGALTGTFLGRGKRR